MSDSCPRSYRAFNASGEVIEMACDSWSCTVCQKRNAYRAAERVRYGLALRGDRDAYFWTLTLPAYVQTPQHGFRVLPGLWDRLRRKMQRTVKAWDYAAFVELHPHRADIPHFHIISLAAAPCRLKDLAASCGFGYMAAELPCTSKMAAVYVTKYCSKQGRAMPRGFRRVRLSHRWPRLPEPEYEVPIYPQKSRESVRAYIRRVAGLTGIGYDELLKRWLVPGEGLS